MRLNLEVLGDFNDTLHLQPEPAPEPVAELAPAPEPVMAAPEPQPEVVSRPKLPYFCFNALFFHYSFIKKGFRYGKKGFLLSDL